MGWWERVGKGWEGGEGGRGGRRTQRRVGE